MYSHSSEIRGLCLMKFFSETLQNPHSFFFHFINFIWMPWFMSLKLLRECIKAAWNEKGKKKFAAFVFQKYGKIWSVSLEHFIKDKPFISKECYCWVLACADVVVYTTNSIQPLKKRDFGHFNYCKSFEHICKVNI